MTGVSYPSNSGQWGAAFLLAYVTGNSGGYTCSWTFGDGGSSPVCGPTHSWTSAGTFTVTLTVTNGATHATHTMTVGVNAASLASSPSGGPSLWGWAITVPCTGVAVGGLPGQPCGVPIIFPGIGAGGVVTTQSTNYKWSPGDGSQDISGQAFYHLYTTGGPFTAVQTATVNGYAYQDPVTMDP